MISFSLFAIPGEAGRFARESFGAVSRCTVPESGATHTCGVFVFACKSTSTAANSTHLPSGETTGSSTRLSFIISSNVKGCLVWATTGKERRTERKIHRARIDTSTSRDRSLIHPWIDYPNATAIKIVYIACRQSSTMNLSDRGDLCIKLRHGTTASPAPPGNSRKCTSRVFLE